ncbi:MAG: DUF3500 domain-containing protein, partial [Zavarzinella sp.]|nr:DUF3500 domain-containing protein [Zavarzinella sp.]
MKDFTSPCPECDGLDRRDFVRTLAVGGAALAAGGTALLPRVAIAGERGPMPRVVNTVAEDLVKELYATLDADQKKAVVKPWDHPARKSVNPNKALDKKIGAVYTKPQQELLERIVRAIASDDKGWHQITRNGTWDATKSFDNCGADIFGDPANGKFAFEFTGHHLTVRCDGDSEEGAAFGGPIYYGHSPNGYNPANVFAYQTRQVMKAYDALDEKQRKAATVAVGTPGEGAKSIQLKKDARLPGIAFAELTKDQQELVEHVMKAVLSPFRQQDGAEVVSIIKAMGGMEKVHLAFYTEEWENAKTNEKQPWSFWRLEGPGFVWNFRVL